MSIRRTFQFVDPYGMLQIRLSILDLTHAALYQRYPEDSLEIRWCRSEEDAHTWLRDRGTRESHIYQVVPIESASESAGDGTSSGRTSQRRSQPERPSTGSLMIASSAGSLTPSSTVTRPRHGTAGGPSRHSEASSMSPEMQAWIQGRSPHAE